MTTTATRRVVAMRLEIQHGPVENRSDIPRFNAERMRVRVLLVEDDADVSDALSNALSLEAHRVEVLREGSLALAALETDAFDAVILDLGLPHMDGLEVLRRIRSTGNTVPVLILTARDQVHDRVAGLDSGADDYLPKPFDIYELNARLRAITRRSHGRATPRITAGGVELDPATREVRRDGVVVDISPKEYAILSLLMESLGEVVSRERLTTALYGWDLDGIDSNTLDVHLSHLRRKLGKDLIRTLRGIGYIIDRQ
jgi:two-component system, OmpR family, response regulator QseB